MTKAALHREAVRLRIQERQSLAEIHAALPVAKSTLSVWLRAYPLTPEEKQARIDNRRRSGPPRKERGQESKHHRALQGRKLTSEHKGRIAEAAVFLRLVRWDFTVYRSPFHGDKVDFVVQPPGSSHLLRLQVRCVKEGRAGLPTVRLLCSAGRKKFRRYTDDEFDAVIGYDLFTDTAYVFPRENIRHIRSLVTIAGQYAEAWELLIQDEERSRPDSNRRSLP